MPFARETFRRSASVIVLAVIGLAACSDSNSVEPPATPESLTLRGIVEDSAFAPVNGALTEMRIYSADSLMYWGDPLPFAITDSLGQFTLSWDSVGPAPIDSIVFAIVAPGCQGPDQVGVLPKSDIPPGPNPDFMFTFYNLQVRPPARTTPGKYCAFGVHPAWGPNSYIFGLEIDSVSGGNVWGRWRLTYNFSSGDDNGSFVGTATATSVDLSLTQDIIWNTCLGMQLHVPVSIAGVWGPASVIGAQACLPQPATFMFVADTLPFPFPAAERPNQRMQLTRAR